MVKPVLLNVDDCRRRPPGDRVLVYLDQSSLSRMVREEAFAGLRELLLEEVRGGRLICPRSPEHDDESRLARANTWEQIDRLSHQLSPGARFRTAAEIENAEIRSAARYLVGRPIGELWEEAFTADPHTAREPAVNFLGSEVMVRAVFRPVDADRAEVNHEKAKEDPLTEAYRETRSEFSFEEICEANLHQLLEWKLGPLASTSKFMANYERRAREMAEEQARGEDPLRPGSAFRRWHAAHQRGQFIIDLCRELPELRDRAEEFFYGPGLRTMPSLLLFAYLRAGLAVTPGRTAKRGDGYDIHHLIHGLSRCDIVTADRGMVEMVRARRLVPDGCQLFESSDINGLTAVVEAALSAEHAQAPD
jgi:hypothetical protein